MKVLIWFLCIFADALITTLIKEAGVILGAIPTVILYGATFWLARTLCKKWDEHKENKTVDKIIPTQTVQTTSANTTEQVRFCRKCGEKIIENSRFCGKCGTQVVAVKNKPKAFVKCQICENSVEHVTYCEIKDDMGTRYRSLCDDCIVKYNAK